jgi:hypothetical protein
MARVRGGEDKNYGEGLGGEDKGYDEGLGGEEGEEPRVRVAVMECGMGCGVGHACVCRATGALHGGQSACLLLPAALARHLAGTGGPKKKRKRTKKERNHAPVSKLAIAGSELSHHMLPMVPGERPRPPRARTAAAHGRREGGGECAWCHAGLKWKGEADCAPPFTAQQ